jgi:NitT/TauT family transport system substrate-binding protein
MHHSLARFIAGSAVSAVLLAGSAAPANAADNWRFGVVEAKGDAGILFMPEKFGGKYGVDIKMVEFASSTTPVRALLSGDIDVYTTSPSIALTAMSRGAKLKFIGCNWPGATYVLYGAPDVKNVAQLKGKSVGVSGPGSMPDLFTREILTKNGLAETDVTYANAGGGSDRFKALLAGIVQATATSSEFVPQAKSAGFNILASAHDETPDFSRNCLVTTEKIIETRRDGLIRFLAANMDAIGHVLSHRDETIALTRQVAHLQPNDASAAFIYDEAVAEKDLDPTMAAPLGKLQWIEDVLLRHKIIPAGRNVADFVDDTPRQSALKLVKP